MDALDNDSWIRLASSNRDQGIAIYEYEMKRAALQPLSPIPPAVPTPQATTFSDAAGKFLQSVSKGDDDGD